MTDHKYATPFTMLHAANLLGQRSRLIKFKQAIDRVVKKGDYVVDIGTGSGVLAILAAKAGASRVSAIDVNPEALHYAKSAARANDVDDVIEFVESHFADYSPTDKADVVICEMLSSMMLVEQQIPASHHATQTILKPNGILLPKEINVYIVPVECPEIWDRFQFEGLKFPRVVQTATPDATRDLADMQILETFDLTNLPEKPLVDKVSNFMVESSGTIHGIVGAFESQLYGDILLTMEDGWKQLFIPLPYPIDVSKEDIFSLRISYEPGKYDSLIIETL
ncbi:MAG: 50S ribosomal protein L11 methyltransferase [Candidatus Thorarchaeota archaeon]